MATYYECPSCREVFDNPRCPKNGCSGRPIPTQLSVQDMDRLLSYNMPQDVRSRLEAAKQRALGKSVREIEL